MEILSTYSASTVYDQLASLKDKEVNTIDKQEFRKSTSESYDVAASTDQAQPEATDTTELLKAEDEILNRTANLNKLLINSLQEDISAS